jgi:hypothetical protein
MQRSRIEEEQGSSRRSAGADECLYFLSILLFQVVLRLGGRKGVSPIR